MTNLARWIVGTAAVIMGSAVLASMTVTLTVTPANSQSATAPVPAAPVQRKAAAPRGKKAPASQPPVAAAQPHQLPARLPFSAADEAAAAVPGMPDARFWADSTTDFNNALPSQPGPWLALSSGGSDGAF